MVVALPLTKTLRGWPTRVPIQPPEGNLRVASEILCDQIRALATVRLLRRLGAVTPATMQVVEGALRRQLRL